MWKITNIIKYIKKLKKNCWIWKINKSSFILVRAISVVIIYILIELSMILLGVKNKIIDSFFIHSFRVLSIPLILSLFYILMLLMKTDIYTKIFLFAIALFPHMFHTQLLLSVARILIEKTQIDPYDFDDVLMQVSNLYNILLMVTGSVFFLYIKIILNWFNTKKQELTYKENDKNKYVIKINATVKNCIMLFLDKKLTCVQLKNMFLATSYVFLVSSYALIGYASTLNTATDYFLNRTFIENKNQYLCKNLPEKTQISFQESQEPIMLSHIFVVIRYPVKGEYTYRNAECITD